MCVDCTAGNYCEDGKAARQCALGSFSNSNAESCTMLAAGSALSYTLDNVSKLMVPTFAACADGEEPNPATLEGCVPCRNGYAGMGGVCKQCGENETFFREKFADEFGSRFQSSTCPEDVPWFKTGPFILSMLAVTFVVVGFGAVVGCVKGGHCNECNKPPANEDKPVADMKFEAGTEVANYQKTGKLMI
jgi:hypothetical protein